MDEKTNDEILFEYRLKLTQEEMEMLSISSKFTGLQIDEYFKMLIRKDYFNRRLVL